MTIVSRRGATALALAAALAPVLTGRAHAAGVSFTDAVGRNVVLRGPAERIVVNFYFEEFTAVGGAAAWDRVVGISRDLWAGWRAASFRRYQAAIPRLGALPDVGNTADGNFSVEKVIALRPDLLLLADWAYPALKEQVAQLEALGIAVAVIDYNAGIPERHIASCLALGLALGDAARGAALAQLYTGKLAELQARAARGIAADGGRRPKVYVELGMGGADAVGNTYWKVQWGRLIELVGAENIAAGRLPGAGDRGPLNPEYLIAADPDAIFIAGSSWANRPAAVLTGFDVDIALTRARLAPYTKRQGWDRLAAIRNGRLFAVEHGLCGALWEYTAMQFMAKALWPAVFADVDPEGELRAFHATYLPVAFEGCWMAQLAPNRA